MTGALMSIGWETIQALQQKTGSRPIVDTSKPGDYGADPIGDGTFRMVPSGDIVDYAERCQRLGE